MPQKSFSASIDAFVRQTKERMTAVFRESTERVIGVMQEPGPSKGSPTAFGKGNMPVVKGFLRASLRAVNGRIDSLPAVKADGVTVNYDAGSVSLVIANAQIGDAITAIYTANYARRVNYGFVGKDSLGREYNQRGYHFVDKAAQQWVRIVGEVSAELKAQVTGGGG